MRNTIASLYDMGKMHGRVESGHVSGELRELIENSDIEDNPILMIATFKD